MDKYNGLLSTIADRFYIQRGNQESENNWKLRLIYSVCGTMAYASLWDNLEKEPISIIHFKNRIEKIFNAYRSIYPELNKDILFDSKDLEDEIEKQFLNTGIVYHRSKLITPSMKREELYDNILFQRGISIDNISCVSGLGFYSKLEGTRSQNRIKEMFGLEQKNLNTLWNSILKNTNWEKNLSFEFDAEYLNLQPSVLKPKYWIKEPNTTGTVSILRTGMRGSKLYYLYRYSGTTFEISPLPRWRVESSNYRTLACGCLLYNGSLPPIEYFTDGSIVHVYMKYLLPPHELEFLKLYSWPEKCNPPLCDFKRILSTEVFNSIRSILIDEGYEFLKKETLI